MGIRNSHRAGKRGLTLGSWAPPPRLAKVLTICMLTCIVLSGLFVCGLEVAWAGTADSGTVIVDYVPENEFEPKGYSGSLNFTGVEIVSGFERVSNPSDYAVHNDYDGYLDPNSSTWLDWYYRADYGYVAKVNASTPENAEFKLRYTGGTYKGDAVDAVVTLKNIQYLEYADGWEKWWEYDNANQFQTGIYLVPDVVSDGSVKGQYNNFNFYSLGIGKFDVEVEWFYANTTTPAEVKGHMTCIDLDWGQTFGFGGSVVGGRLAANNDAIVMEDEGRLVRGISGLSDDWNVDREDYKQGLVSTYYNTCKDKDEHGWQGRYKAPSVYHFGTSWDGSSGTAESYFALTPAYLTVPNPDDEIEGQPTPAKAADKTSGVSVGDEVTYTVEAVMHTEGVNCRGGYRYTNLDILDYLPSEMRYVDGSGYLVDEAGSKVNAGSVIYEGEQEDPAQNVVRYEFDSQFLADTALRGQKYRFIFKAELTEYPRDGKRNEAGSLYVRNGGAVRINNKGEKPTNNVDTTLVEPKFSVNKYADDYEFEVGEIVSYTVTYRQTEKNAQSRETVISDNLPEYLELIADSVKATGIRDLPEPSVEGNKWSYGFDKFNYGDTITVTYRAKVLNSGNGREVVNNASIHANNAMDADDPEEIYVNTADLEVSKEADRYECYVGPSDQDPGFVTYTVVARNAKEGTVANGVVITDDSLPEGMKVGRTNEGNLMVEVSANDGSATEDNMSWDGSEATGSFASFAYRAGEDDHDHNQTQATQSTWKLTPEGAGWKLAIDHLNYGVDVTITYRAYPEDAVSGWEIENKVQVEAKNSLADEDSAKVWVNQPHLKVEKRAAQDKLTVGDTILYHIDVTCETPGTLGRDLVISDLAHTEGVHLQRGSIRTYDSEGRDITDTCTVTTRHGNENTFIIETHRNIVSASDARPVWSAGELGEEEGKNPLGEGGETKVSVEYQVYIADAELAGKTVDNTAQAVTDEPNTSTTDDEVVSVKGARLVVEKSSDKQRYEVGATATYTLVARQTREDGVAKNVVVKDAMGVSGVGELVEGSVRAVFASSEEGETPIEAKPDYAKDEEGRIVGFTLETGRDLADEQSITVTYEVDLMGEGALPNKVQVSGDGAVGGVDAHEVEVVPTRSAVTLEKRVDVSELSVGETATYTLVATVAENPAANVTISDKSLPAGMPVDLRGIRAELNGKELGELSVDVSGNGFVARLGELEPNDVVRLTYTARAADEKLAGASVVNTAWLTTPSIDDPISDSAYVTVADKAKEEDPDPETPDPKPAEPEPAAEASLVKKVSERRPVAGERVEYTLVARVEEGSLGRTMLTDEPEDGIAIDADTISVSVNGARSVVPKVELDDEGAFALDLGELQEGAEVRVSYEAVVDGDADFAGEDLGNVATLTAEELDPKEAKALVTVREDRDDPEVPSVEDPDATQPAGKAESATTGKRLKQTSSGAVPMGIAGIGAALLVATCVAWLGKRK